MRLVAARNLRVRRSQPGKVAVSDVAEGETDMTGYFDLFYFLGTRLLMLIGALYVFGLCVRGTREWIKWRRLIKQENDLWKQGRDWR